MTSECRRCLLEWLGGLGAKVLTFQTHSCVQADQGPRRERGETWYKLIAVISEIEISIRAGATSEEGLVDPSLSMREPL